MPLESRRLKNNPNFQPSFKNDDDELFPNGIFVFNITKLLVFIQFNRDAFKLEEVEVKSVRINRPHNLNQEKIKTADVWNPILLAEIAPERFNVIDGNHRLEKAFLEGKRTILAYKIHPEQHTLFLTSKKAYDDYIAYWNSKIENRIEDEKYRIIK